MKLSNAGVNFNEKIYPGMTYGLLTSSFLFSSHVSEFVLKEYKVQSELTITIFKRLAKPFLSIMNN